MKHYSFPKIRQYHQVIRGLKLQFSYQGKDDDGNSVYKEPDTWPVVKFRGNVKLHGTNAAIVFTPDGSFYCQSRENVIDEIKDNAGFAHWVNKEGYKIWPSLWYYLGVTKNNPSQVSNVILFGEWCGGSIQNRVALNKLSKRFVIFGLKVIFEDETTKWIDSSGIKNSEINVYNVEDAPTYKIEVDLNRPDKAIEQMNQWVDEIDTECPFAKMFDISGHGEGIVWRQAGVYGYNDAFKTKGESHSESKIKKLPTVDVQKMDNLQQAIDVHCHEDRMEQIYNKVVLNEADKIPQNTAAFVRLLIEDCWEEEGDSIRASDISRKEFSSAVSKKAAKWFQNKLQQF